MIRKISFLAIAIGFLISSQTSAQKISSTRPEFRAYKKIQSSLMRGFKAYDLDGEMTIVPGSGVGGLLALGYGQKMFDVEMQLEGNWMVVYQYEATYTNSGSSTYEASASLLKFSINPVAYFNLPVSEKVTFRFGAGPSVTIPSRLKATLNNNKLLDRSYSTSFGYLGEISFLIHLPNALKNPNNKNGLTLNPGIRIKSGKTKAQVQEGDKFDEIKLGGLDLMFALIF